MNKKVVGIRLCTRVTQDKRAAITMSPTNAPMTPQGETADRVQEGACSCWSSDLRREAESPERRKPDSTGHVPKKRDAQRATVRETERETVLKICTVTHRIFSSELMHQELRSRDRGVNARAQEARGRSYPILHITGIS